MANGLRLQSKGLGLRLGTVRCEIEGNEHDWLRWIDANGKLLPTGSKDATEQQSRADAETKRADAETERSRELEELFDRTDAPPRWYAAREEAPGDEDGADCDCLQSARSPAPNRTLSRSMTSSWEPREWYARHCIDAP